MPAVYTVADVAMMLGISDELVRRGAVLALTWNEVDMDAGTVEIKRSVDDRGRLKEPKTKRSRRVLPLPSFAARALAVIRGEQAERRLQLGRAYDPAGWVCADEIGRMLRPDYVSVWFPRLCERAGIRRLRFHDLRHTHSTLLAQAGHSMQLVAARMGHSTIQTTANIYSHLAASEDRAAADVLDRIVEEDR